MDVTLLPLLTQESVSGCSITGETDVQCYRTCYGVVKVADAAMSHVPVPIGPDPVQGKRRKTAAHAAEDVPGHDEDSQHDAPPDKPAEEDDELEELFEGPAPEKKADTKPAQKSESEGKKRKAAAPDDQFKAPKAKGAKRDALGDLKAKLS